MKRFLQVVALRSFLAFALSWCVLVEVVEAFASLLFAMELDGDWFLIIAASDVKEMANFFSLYWVQVSVGIGAIISLISVVFVCAFWLRMRWVVLLMLMFAGYVCIGICMHGRGWKPLYVAYDTIRSAGEYAELISAGSWTEERGAAVRDAKLGAPNVVFVIGESLTTDRMSVYGYSKRTTPRLEALRSKMAFLGPIKTTHPDTARALRMMLSKATAGQPDFAEETMPVSFRLHGYRTALISAQGHWERYCGIEQMIFAACETRTYLCEVKQGKACYDADMLPLIRSEFLKQDKRPLALFVHMAGSHFAPGDRVPDDFRTPRGFDDYDRSVLYTDHVLSALIDSLPDHTVMIFVSDHGESVDCDGWRDLRSQSLWNVPFMVYPSSMSQMFNRVTDIGEIWYNSVELWN